MSLDDISREIEGTDQQIRDAGYQGEILFRPPYGKKLVLLPWYLADTNRTTIMWDLEPESYDDIADDPQAIATARLWSGPEPARERRNVCAAIPHLADDSGIVAPHVRVAAPEAGLLVVPLWFLLGRGREPLPGAHERTPHLESLLD